MGILSFLFLFVFHSHMHSKDFCFMGRSYSCWMGSIYSCSYNTYSLGCEIYVKDRSDNMDKRIFYVNFMIFLGISTCIIGYMGIQMIYLVVSGTSTIPELDTFCGFVGICVSIMTAIATYTLYRDMKRGIL